MNHELEEDENIYTKMETALVSNMQDILDAYDFEKEREEFMRTISIPTVVQESLQEIGPLHSTISTPNEWKEAMEKAPNGAILKVDREIVVDSINEYRTSLAQDFHNLEGQEEWSSLINKICQGQSDFLIAFYIIYSSLHADSKRNKLPFLLPILNRYYQTDYKNLEDILEKNNLKTSLDLKKYVDSYFDSQNKSRRI